MRRSLMIASTLLAVAASARGQEVLLRVGGQPGQSMKYQSQMETFMGGPMAAMAGGDTTQPFMRRTAFLTRAVTAVSGDTITMTETTDSAHIETPANPQMAMMMQQMAGSGQVVTTKMNDRGIVYSTDMQMAGGQGGMGGMNMGGGGGMGSGRGPGGPGGRGGMMGGGMGRNQRAMFSLPKNPVRVGDTWTDTLVVPAPSPDEPTSTMVATYNLKRVDQQGGDRVAVVAMTGTISTSGGQGGPQQMNMNGEYQLDVTARRLAGMTMQLSGTVQTQRGAIPMKMNMTQTPLP